MAYVPVPKDLTKVKTKVMFNLTKGSSFVLEAARFSAFRFSFCSKGLPEPVRRPCAWSSSCCHFSFGDV